MELSTAVPKPVPLLAFFEYVSPTNLAYKLQEPLKHQIIEQFGIAQMTEVQNSMEQHKEVKDKECVKTLLVGLLPTKGDRVTFAEEVMFCLPADVKGPHGLFDLMVGIQTQQEQFQTQQDQILTLCADGLEGAVFGRVKSETQALSRVRIDAELGVTAQAAIELLSASQLMTPASVPKLLFLANRYYCRPFLYFKDVDILVTTKEAFAWRNKDMLQLKGVCAIAVLLQCGEAYLKGFGTYLQVGLQFPSTGFAKAMCEMGITLSGGTLKPTCIPIKRIMSPQDTCKDPDLEEDCNIMRKQAKALLQEQQPAK